MLRKFVFFLCVGLHPIFVIAQGKEIVFPALSPASTVENYHGKEIPDPFRFLEESRSSISKNWLLEQEKMHDHYFEENNNVNAFRKRIEIRSQYENTLERRMGNYFFSYRFINRSEAPLLYFRKANQKIAKELVNPSRFVGAEKSIVSIVDFKLSPDQRFLAIVLSRSGAEWKEIRVVDMASKRVLLDELQWIKLSSIAWMENGFYYSRFDTPPIGEEKTALNLNSKVMYHRLGSTQSSDVLIFEQQNLPFGIFDVQQLNTNKLVLYGAEESPKGFVQKIFLRNGLSQNDTLIPFISNADLNTYSYEVVAEVDERILVLTNRFSNDKALYWFDPKGKNEASLFKPSTEDIIRAVYYYNDRIIVLYSSNMLQHLCVYDKQGNELDRLYFNDGSSITQFSAAATDSIVYFYKNNYTSPARACSYNLNSFELKENRKVKLNYSRDEIISELKYYPSYDGTLIPITLLHRADMKYNANQATMVYGYGGFGVPIEPFYDPGFIFFIQNGGVIAIPGIRGGGEKGEAWHQAGRMFQKQNSIEDFAYAAKFLIKNRISNPSKLIARGSSNGALVIAAALNKYPELFRASVLEMGIYDMLRYDLFTTGYASVTEYGSSTNEKSFEYLLGYSPIHNIKAFEQFPALYIITGENDERVPSFHSYKYTASLQNKLKPQRPILLHTQQNAGHYGAQSFEDLIGNEARIYSFIFRELGLKIRIE
jgi:prolyl oligopeptidase